MKSPFASKTLWGLVVALLGPWLMRKTGVKLDDVAQQELVEQIVTAAGALLTIYGRFTADVPLKNPLISDKLPLLLALGLASGVWGLGCASLTANQNAVLKAVAKAAVVFGLNQLGDSVKEVRPYTPALMGVINATFSAADRGESIGDGLAAGVESVVQDQAVRAQVLAAIKTQLKGATAANAEGGTQNAEARFKHSIAARL